MPTVVRVNPGTTYQVNTFGNVTGLANTYDGYGGTKPGNVVIRDLRKAAAAVEPRMTPFLTTVGYGPSVEQEWHEWARRGVVPIQTTLAAGYTTGSSTYLTITTGEGKFLAPYHVLLVDSEIFWVTGYNAADQVNVIGAQGGTTGANHSTSAVVRVIGSAMPQGSDYSLNPYAWGDQYYNVPQRFSGAIKTDRREDVTPNIEIQGSQHDQRVADELGTQKLLLEQTLFRGRRQVGTNPGGAGNRPSMMGGLNDFIGKLYTLAGTPLLNIYHLEDCFYDFDQSVGENAPRQIIMNMATKRIINRLMNTRREGTMDTTSAKLVWNEVEFATGAYSFMVSRWCPDGEIWVLNTKDLHVMPYKSLGWHERELPVSGEHLWTGVGMDATFEVSSPKCVAKITGWDTTLANYPGLS